MRSAFDFAPYRRSTIGFDRLFDLLENNGIGQGSESYPPFDLIKMDNNHYRINLAVAGFAREEIDITAQQNQLIVTGKKSDDDKVDYVHRGIANRQFERRFGLADFIKVTEADLKDGLLSIDLVREIPEAMRPRRISIGGSQGNQASIESAEKQTVEATAQESAEARHFPTQPNGVRAAFRTPLCEWQLSTQIGHSGRGEPMLTLPVHTSTISPRRRGRLPAR